jgi:hypothetical protein
MQRDKGILYIATGEKYREEAVCSACSVKRVWPEIPVALITGSLLDAPCFDKVHVVKTVDDKTDRARYLGCSPFKKTIYLDTDTFCLHPFPEVFDVLNSFDLALAYDVGRFSQRWDQRLEKYSFIYNSKVPEAFPEYNVGVIAFRRQFGVRKLFKKWYREFLKDRTAEIPCTQDQPSFRRVIYLSRLRVGTLPSEYNFRLGNPDYARMQIKLLHGRWRGQRLGNSPTETYMRLGKVFNTSEGCPRVFVEAFGMIVGHGPLANAFHRDKDCALVFKDAMNLSHPPTIQSVEYF